MRGFWGDVCWIPAGGFMEAEREEVPACKMCRAGMHKYCIKIDGLLCLCDCERGY